MKSFLKTQTYKTNFIEKSEITSEEKTAQKEILYRDYSIKSERIHTMNQLLKAYEASQEDED